jgi:SNF2 family DNA or RNA helicase
MIELAKKRGYAYGLIDGSITSTQERTNTVNDFQAGKLKVLFAHAASAGHGLTLTRGCCTIWASPTDNAEHFVQANARIYRGGQTRKTETILISAENTVDTNAYANLTDKITAMDDLLEMLR